MSESDHESRLEAVFEKYLGDAEAGRPFDRRKAIEANPDLASDLVDGFAAEACVKAAIRSARRVPPPVTLPFRFGKYEVLEELGRGGMGVVYKARDLGLGKLVALKVIRMGQFASAAEITRFQEEARAASELDHPNIVPIYELGEHDAQPYFTMKLIEGKSLQADLDAYRNEPIDAVRLMATVAGAVRNANRRMILHRDLKPGNILLDAAGQPHVTDFGLAKRLDAGGEVSATGELVGTIPYMAPEQFSSQKKRLGVSVDVYGLGATLFSLVTGRPPFLGETLVDTIRKIQEDPPPDPRTVNPRVSAPIAAICLKCLQKDPSKRYENATVLTERLEAVRDGRPIPEVPEGRATRIVRWVRRHAGALLLAATAAALVLSVAGHFLFRAASRAGRREEILEGNVFTARFAANVILGRMQEWATRVESMARSPELVELLSAWNKSLKDRPYSRPEDVRERPEAKRLQEFLNNLPKEPLVVNWHLMDTHGVMVARTPAAIVGVDFRERDYFKGTLGHVGRKGLASVHVSSVYRSQMDGLDKFDICAPVVEGSTVIGVVAVAVTTDPTLGVPHIQSQQRKVVLIGPWDPSPPNKLLPTERPPEFVVLLHPSMVPGQEAVPLDRGMLPAGFPRTCDHELSLNDTRPAKTLMKSDYRDPFASRDPQYRGRWLAGFAPVGSTGFVVIVQQLEE